MAGKSLLRSCILILVVLLNESLANPQLVFNNRSHVNVDGNDLVLNCVKGIVEIEHMRNILILGRPEHFHKLDVSPIGSFTTMKIYKRIGGWTFDKLSGCSDLNNETFTVGNISGQCCSTRECPLFFCSANITKWRNIYITSRDTSFSTHVYFSFSYHFIICQKSK